MKVNYKKPLVVQFEEAIKEAKKSGKVIESFTLTEVEAVELFDYLNNMLDTPIQVDGRFAAEKDKQKVLKMDGNTFIDGSTGDEYLINIEYNKGI